MNIIQKILKYVLPLFIITTGCYNGSEEIIVDPEMPCNYSNDIIMNTTFLNWEDIYKDSITTFVGQTIVIMSKVYWNIEFGYFDSIPEINPAGNIKLLFENADNFIPNSNFHNQNRGDLFIISAQIEKYISDNEKQEKYALNCEELSNGVFYYLLQGRIEYRDSLSVHINDPVFISQSNNVTYWSQTFEFKSDIIHIIK